MTIASPDPLHVTKVENIIAAGGEGSDELKTAKPAESRHRVMVRHSIDHWHVAGRSRMGALPVDPGDHYAGLNAASLRCTVGTPA